MAAQPGVESCVWCGSPMRPDAVQLAGRTRCPRCRAATTDPWPNEEELENAYGTWYRPQSGRRFSMIGDALLSRTRATLARRLDAIAPAGRVLDVGAGDGTLIDALQGLGRSATGLERDARHPRVLDQSLEEVEGEWAAVVFWHSLEHLPEPGRAIRESARLLARGGVVVVAVPNTDSLQARVFGSRWLHLDIPRHLVHLSARSLTSGLESRGFEIERVSGIRGGQIVIGWLDGLVGSLPGGLNLYQALRRPQARSVSLPPARRLASLAAGVLLLPVAAACAALEIALRRSGTIYVEARLG